MRPRSYVVGLLLLLLVALMAYADAPWKDKVSSDWTPDDVRRILENSPWAQVALVNVTWVRFGRRGLETETTAKVLIESGDKRLKRRDSDPPDASTQAFDEKVIFRVLWVSAETVRQAVERGSALITPSLDRTSVRRAPTEGSFVLVLHGEDMTPFEQMEDAELLEKTWLRFDTEKTRLKPERLERSGTGRSGGLTQIIFFFPKHLPNGEAVNTMGTRTIEFQCEGWQGLVRVKFQPLKMLGRQGQDL